MNSEMHVHMDFAAFASNQSQGGGLNLRFVDGHRPLLLSPHLQKPCNGSTRPRGCAKICGQRRLH